MKYCEKEFYLSNEINDNSYDNEINDFLKRVNDIVRFKDTYLSDKVLNRLINLLKLFNKYRSPCIDIKRDYLKNNIIKELKEC